MTTVEKLRNAYQAWHDTRGASTGAWMDLLADDVTFRSVADGAPAMKFSAPRRSKAEVVDYFAALTDEWEMLFFHAEEFIGEGDRVVMVGRCGWRARATGKEVESPIVAVWKFRDGRAVEYFEFYDTAKAFAAAHPS